jgi:hypothetical protein
VAAQEDEEPHRHRRRHDADEAETDGPAHDDAGDDVRALEAHVQRLRNLPLVVRIQRGHAPASASI